MQQLGQSVGTLNGKMNVFSDSNKDLARKVKMLTRHVKSLNGKV